MLLSICIPTYNRSKSLTKLLDSIVQQKTDMLFEVRIQDNDSTDNTKEIVERYCSQFSNWYYEKNEQNLGGKVNIKKCTEKAIGDYLIIIGDDDTLVDNSLNYIYDSIKNDLGDTIYFSRKLGGYYVSCRKFKTGMDWIQKVALNEPAFISAVVWKTEFWNSFDYYENIRQYHLPQLHCFINASLSNKTCGVNKDLVEKGRDNPSNVVSYWFYKFHALVDCFEYPYLYQIILNDKNIGVKNRFYILVRKMKLLKEIIKKIAFIKNNRDDYKEYIHILKSTYTFPPFTPLIRLYIYIIFNTSFGEKMALKICPKL